jgi:hypothetical protein
MCDTQQTVLEHATTLLFASGVSMRFSRMKQIESGLLTE